MEQNVGGFTLNMDDHGWEERMVEQLREQVGNLLAAAQLLTPAIREQKEQKYDLRPADPQSRN